MFERFMTNQSLINKPIGVFDSGVGGLSVLRTLRQQLSTEQFLYVADTGHAPYGDRSAQFIASRAIEVGRFFVHLNVKAIVIACNTASVVAASTLRDQLAVPVVAMEPAIKPATKATQFKVVLVLATSGTVRSESVARLCNDHGKDVRIILQACPGLADQVERGEFSSESTRALLRQYLQFGLAQGADTIVLGCTHYAFLTNEIKAIVGATVQIIEPSLAIADQLVRVLSALPLLPSVPLTTAPNTASTTRYYTSGPIDKFASFLRTIGEPIEDVLSFTDPVSDAINGSLFS
jgi:glutamate racemase